MAEKPNQELARELKEKYVELEGYISWSIRTRARS
jgi:hypothetical protein